MILSIVGVEPGPKTKRVAAEFYVRTTLLPILPTARKHSSGWSQTTDLTDGASM